MSAPYIRTMGTFQVVRDRNPVDAAQWPSKKARELLKLLIARRGRPTARELLVDSLWPDDDPSRCANRLSVALSTIRTVLDPYRRYAPDHFVSTDKYVVSLSNVTIDVEVFLAAAREAVLRYERDEPDAVTALALAEAGYAGDFLVEDRYYDWAVGLRELARASYLDLVRTLATAAAGSGDYERAQAYQLLALERDPFDEQAHLGLINALACTGKYDRARRQYRDYQRQMDRIGIEPVPFQPDREQSDVRNLQVAVGW
jgi:DNA-binding SARP family transcriptional activator